MQIPRRDDLDQNLTQTRLTMHTHLINVANSDKGFAIFGTFKTFQAIQSQLPSCSRHLDYEAPIEAEKEPPNLFDQQEAKVRRVLQ